MSYTEQDIRSASTSLIQAFGDLLTWKWEEEKCVLLAEFASGKAEQVTSILQNNFKDEWNKKSIKKAPQSLIKDLGVHAKLIKEQRVFTNSPDGEKCVTALLWPWGHGSTLSLRLTLIETPYQYVTPPEKKRLLSKLFKRRKKS